MVKSMNEFNDEYLYQHFNEIMVELKENRELIEKINSNLEKCKTKIDNIQEFVNNQTSLEETTKSFIINTIANLFASYIEGK